jgi:ABC-type multidrug transport system ATPase subunit
MFFKGTSTKTNESSLAQGRNPRPRDPQTIAAVRVVGLMKRYADGTAANRGIDLKVRRGEVVSVLGPNGAGKTTFLRQLTTELKPSAGRIEIFGVDAVREPERAKSMMGITPQEAGLFETLTVREHFELFARFKGLNKSEAGLAAFEVAEELGLDAEIKKRVGTLSGGQRRRILIGLALLGRPPLLVLDEPTTGLDPASRQSVWKVIRRVVANGVTIIFSTHYIEEAERLSDRIAIIERGRLLAYDTLDKLFARLERSYRVSHGDPFDPLAETSVQYFATFTEAQGYVADARLSEYSIARASLEDIYFSLTGEHPEGANVGEGA